jgi:hypothetical protein
MGGSQSSNNYPTPPPAPPPPPPAPPVPIMTLPLQKVPVLDGASGLHYSGQVYMNQHSQLSTDICQGSPAVSLQQIYADYPKDKMVSNPNLTFDSSTKRVSASAVQGHVENLKGSGIIPGQVADFNKQVEVDKKFYADIQKEYCFYETRYKAALTQFLTEVSNPNGTNATTSQNILDRTITINKRLNSLLETLSYVGNERARNVNERSTKIDSANADINKKIADLKAQQKFLQSGDVRIQTQEEMMRYSKEKNSAMNIQLMFFVAMNVVALGTVFIVYKNVKVSV